MTETIYKYERQFLLASGELSKPSIYHKKYMKIPLEDQKKRGRKTKAESTIKKEIKNNNRELIDFVEELIKKIATEKDLYKKRTLCGKFSAISNKLSDDEKREIIENFCQK